MASKEIEFIKNVDRLHAFYTENVRMLAAAYDLTDEDAARVLARFEFNNVSRAILHPPRVETPVESLARSLEENEHD
ncbi:hypothetical protein [Kytococcus sp. Marseille-QA3725]